MLVLKKWGYAIRTTQQPHRAEQRAWGDVAGSDAIQHSSILKSHPPLRWQLPQNVRLLQAAFLSHPAGMDVLDLGMIEAYVPFAQEAFSSNVGQEQRPAVLNAM